MNQTIEIIAGAINDAGGRLLMVGGAVRDFLLGIEPKDYDFEIFDLWPEEYLPVLGAFGNIEHRGLGKFPTYGLKVNGLDLESASPRIDNKVGQSTLISTSRSIRACRTMTLHFLTITPSTA